VTNGPTDRQTDRQTNRPRYSVGSNRLLSLAIATMPPNNTTTTTTTTTSTVAAAVVMVTADAGAFDPFVARNSFVAVVVAVSEKQSSTLSAEFVVGAQCANIRLERLQFSAF